MWKNGAILRKTEHISKKQELFYYFPNMKNPKTDDFDRISGFGV